MSDKHEPLPALCKIDKPKDGDDKRKRTPMSKAKNRLTVKTSRRCCGRASQADTTTDTASCSKSKLAQTARRREAGCCAISATTGIECTA